MNIVYSSSNSYAEIAGVSITSLFENNQAVSKINLFIIDNGISFENRIRLDKIAEKYNREITYLNTIDLEKLTDISIQTGRWHISTFYRLFLCTILPLEVERVMYIDCDMIIRNSLDDVWNFNMADYWVMGADDCRSENYRLDIGINANCIYINNGFLLIDLKSWRDNGLENIFLKFIRDYHGDVTYMDQGVLNGVLGDMNKIGLLPLKYNAQTVFYDCTLKEIDIYRKPLFAYKEEVMIENLKNPVIVHFTSCFLSGTRPWNVKNGHPYRNEFLYYRNMTPWDKHSLWEDDRKVLKKAMTKISNYFPKKIILYSISIIHSTLYPFIRRTKRKLKRVSK